MFVWGRLNWRNKNIRRLEHVLRLLSCYFLCRIFPKRSECFGRFLGFWEHCCQRSCSSSKSRHRAGTGPCWLVQTDPFQEKNWCQNGHTTPINRSGPLLRPSIEVRSSRKRSSRRTASTQKPLPRPTRANKIWSPEAEAGPEETLVTTTFQTQILS